MTETQTQTEFITLFEAARLLDVHATTVRAMIRDGKIQATKANRVWQVRRDSIVLMGDPPPPPSPLDLAINRYEAARFAQGATPVWNVAYADALVEQDKASKALVSLLAEHGRQYLRKGIAYQTDGEELFRYLEPKAGG